jgi:hypothetical protein
VVDHISDPAFGLLATSAWSACWHRSLLRCERSCDDAIHTRQTYHQDYHPDRTFHGFSLRCGSPGSGNPHAHELYRCESSRLKVSWSDLKATLGHIRRNEAECLRSQAVGITIPSLYFSYRGRGKDEKRLFQKTNKAVKEQPTLSMRLDQSKDTDPLDAATFPARGLQQ